MACSPVAGPVSATATLWPGRSPHGPTRGALPVSIRGPSWLARWASAPVLYLTTMGRRTGRPHRIEIWFAVHDGRIYLLSGGRDRSDWVRNILANPQVTVELAVNDTPAWPACCRKVLPRTASLASS